MKRMLLLAYNGELSCFAHVMLYALDFHEKGYEAKVILEGAATRLIPELANPGAPFAGLYQKLREQGLLAAVCRACSQKMGTMDEAERQNLPIVGDMHGHPSISGYIADGYTVLSF